MAQSNGFLPQWGAGFDPSQASNPYSLFKGAALPWPSTYRGAPTDSKGRVIQPQSYAQAAQAQAPAASPIGTGLASTSTPTWTPELNGMMNSIMANSAKTDGTWGSQARAGVSPDDATTLQQLGAMRTAAGSNIQTPAAQRALEAMRPAGQGGMTGPERWNAAMNVPNTAGPNTPQTAQQQLNAFMQPGGGASTAATGGAAPAAAAATAAQTQSPDMSQAYLDALSNPGHVNTPGATVAQGALPSQQGNVLDQFIANWRKNPGATSGAGGYSNQPFLAGIGAA